jgi:ketosteroid isomerase-like protein
MTEQQFTTWLDAYGRAYTTQDPEVAASLFTENATYQGGPFGELLRGPTEIHRRWAEWANPSEQDLRFEYEILVVTDEIGIARWMASSRFPSDERLVRYDGIFAVRLDDDLRCREFREWWNTQEERIA